MTTIHVSDIKIIASYGGGMILDAKKFHVSDLKIIATNASKSGASIQLENVEHIHISDLKIIAKNSEGHVTFNLLNVNIT